jgi:hypothetical protein
MIQQLANTDRVMVVGSSPLPWLGFLIVAFLLYQVYSIEDGVVQVVNYSSVVIPHRCAKDQRSL